MNIRTILVAAIAMALAACHSHRHESDKESDHRHGLNGSEAGDGHEHEKVQYTVYTGSYELFAEADAFAVGEQANILSHFSRLPSFRPLESGALTVILSVDGTDVRQTLEGPTRKGIYSFDLTPVKAGTGTLRFLIDTAVVTAEDVRVYASHQEAHEQSVHEEPSMVNKVVFTKEQSWKIDFSTEVIQKKAFGQVIKTVARVESGRDSETVIAAKTSGIVMFPGNLLEGKEVSYGQSLLRISSGGMSDNNISVKIAEAKNNFLKAEADYVRKKGLADDKIISERELLEAKTTFENAKAVFENLTGNFNDGGQSVISPLQGFVKQIYVSNGQYVEAGQRLITVSRNESLILSAYVQQQYTGILSRIHSANIKSLQNNQLYTLEELNGKVISFGKSVNDNSFLIPVYLQIDNRDGFVQGSLTEIYLKTLTDSEAVTVVNTALLEEQGNYFVFVQETPELFEKRLVKTGVTDGIRTEIIAGLTPGERIVTRGAMLVRLAQASGALDPHSGHVH